MDDPAGTLEIRVLGPLEVLVDGAPIVVDTRKALAILVALAVDGRSFAREELAALLWPDADDDSARGSLRRTLSVLRTALGDRWLVVDRSTVALQRPAVLVDLATAEDALESGDLARLRAAADLARGPFLTGFALRDSPEFDDWRAARGSSVERLVSRLLDQLADAADAAGDTVTAIEALRRRVALDPLDEDAHRRLLRALVANGERAAAIRQYRSLVGILERELGVPPLAATTELYEAIRDGTLAPTSRPAPPVARGGDGAPAVARAQAPASLPLVGRDAVLARLGGTHAAATPDGRVAVLEGEAGVGKTRLADEVAGRVAADGGRVLSATAHAAESGLAFAAIAALIRCALDSPGAAERIGALPVRVIAEADRLVPLGLTRGPDRGDAPRDTPAARLRFVEALVEVVLALAVGPVPGLVRVDDLHHADESSLEVLAYLARRLTGRPVLLLLAWRPEDLDGAGAALAGRIRDLPGVTAEILGRLPPADTAALARLAGATPRDAEALAAESEGLPLYVVEALAARVAGDQPPRGMRALLRERLARVGETAGQVLAAACVIGRSFDFPTVRAVAGRTEDETLDALDDLVRRGLLREQADGRGWDFTHGRLREAAYEDASLARRRILHRRVADALRARPARDADLDRLVLIARHERDAGRDAEAAEAYWEAGLRARRMLAHPEAIDALEAALALGHPDTIAVQEELAEVRMIGGDYARAVAALEAAAALAPNERLAAIELRLGQVHARRGDVATAASHLESALAGLGDPAADPLARRCLVEQSLVALRAGELDLAAATAQRARAAAEAVGDQATIGLALRVAGLVAHARRDLPGARTALERSLNLASSDADPTATIAAGNALALVEAASGDRDRAVVRLLAARDAAGRAGERHLEAAIENNIADQLHALGRTEDAMAHLRRAVALFADVGGRPGELEPEIWKLVAW